MSLIRRRPRFLTGRMLFSVLLVFPGLAVSSPVSSAVSPAGSQLVQGAQLFQSGDFDAALNVFRQNAAQNPSDAVAQLWLGLGYEATGEIGRAHQAWAVGMKDEQWAKTANYLKGLDFWRRGDNNSALYYFQASLKKAPGYAAAEQAMVEVRTGGLIPPVQRWGMLAGLPTQNGPANSALTPVANVVPVPTPGPSSTPLKPGFTPRAGRWEATVINGYKGDRLSFRVPRSRNQVQDVAFNGTWAVKGSSMGLQTLKNQDPRAPFLVRTGNFSATQQDPKTRLWWEFTGRFTSRNTAEGTYRCMQTGGQADTSKLKWTAKWVGR